MRTRPSASEFIDWEIAAATPFTNKARRFDHSEKEHLGQHERWLERYAVQEAKDRERRARKLKRLQLRQRRRVRRQHVISRWKQFALAPALFVCSIGLSILNGAVSARTYLTELISLSATWTGAKVYGLARLLVEVRAVYLSRLQGQAVGFARLTTKMIFICLCWSSSKSACLHACAD